MCTRSRGIAHWFVEERVMISDSSVCSTERNTRGVRKRGAGLRVARQSPRHRPTHSCYRNLRSESTELTESKQKARHSYCQCTQ